MQTVMTQMAMLTTKSQLLATTAAKMTVLVAAAINQLAANQQTMQQQFAAFTMQCNAFYQPAQVVQPPITQFLIPNFAGFPTESRCSGRRGGNGRGQHVNFGHTSVHNVCTPFANFVRRSGQGGLHPIDSGGRQGGGVVPLLQQPTQRNAAPMYSNIVK